MQIEKQTIEDFGQEWQRFDQTALPEAQLEQAFGDYFAQFPWAALPADAEGFDLGCGSGRWARFVAARVGRLHCVEPSAAIEVARRTLADSGNCTFHQHTVEQLPLAESSMDFGYSLGVLHHLEDTAGALRACVRRLKPGAPFLLYLYYRFDTRPAWFRAVWGASDAVRRRVSQLPFAAKARVCDAIAATVYLPLARVSAGLEKLGISSAGIPLSYYRDKDFYAMRTDALDRFGTKLEKRYTRREMTELMRAAGLGELRFNEHAPYWTAVGFRQS